jgi:hypothetical protein
MAVDELKAGKLKPRPGQVFPIDRKKSCEQIILGVAKIENVSGVRTCFAQPGLIYLSIDLAFGTTVTVIAKFAPEALIPTKIESVGVEEYVITT